MRIASTGETLTGEWVDDMLTGPGKSVRDDGTVYEGDFLDGVRHGFGTLTPGGDSAGRYEGAWVAGRRHGRGRIELPDGSTVVGQFDQGALVRVLEYTFARDSPWADPST